ncbi:hypothetical protein RMSM_02558 [Rhodopirellula maiorica SM1]|uniref:Uncharacterized protein n=1 Tax=Rhodopirellula maiorica SM1 TaxID=1265738 RepID=M5RMU5_9BACT|nr:hypothetical protein [Rhodopirellula maiorica]EMI20526.1 hypothetical protein RMSM_02558 [Rhodopirellula maiorica SM1]
MAKQLVRNVKSEDTAGLGCDLSQLARHARKRPFHVLNIHRLVLRPMTDHDRDPDIQQRLELIVATIVAASNGHAKMTQHKGSYCVFAIFFGTHVFERCLISWLAHHAAKNHWSLMEDGDDSEVPTFTPEAESAKDNLIEKIRNSIENEKRDEFGSLRIGEDFIYGDIRYRKIDASRAARISTRSGFAETALLFYPDDNICPLA